MFRKKGVIALVVIVLLLSIGAAGVYYVKENYTVHTIYVEGNYHYSQQEIIDLVMEGPLGNNSLFLSSKYKNKSIKGVPFIDVMDVTVVSPNTIRITVYEKALAGYVEYMNTNMYFDKDGYLVENSSVKTEGVPQITGLSFEYAVLGQPLPVENEEIFTYIMSLTKLLNKYALTADRIHFAKDESIYLYFDGVRVNLGKEEDRLEDKLMLLPTFLPTLQGKSGTLHMETYDESGGKYTFIPENF